MRVGPAHMLKRRLVACSKSSEVRSPFCKALGAIWATPNNCGIFVILPIVFPGADWTDLEATPL